MTYVQQYQRDPPPMISTIPDFFRQLNKHKNTLYGISTIKDMVRIINHATIMMPWIHITYEWAVINERKQLELVGELGSGMVLTATALDGRLKISLRDDDSIQEHASNPHDTSSIIVNQVASTKEHDIIGGFSVIINEYASLVSTASDGKWFREYQGVQCYKYELYNEITHKKWLFVEERKFLMSPSKQTLYDYTEGVWVHPKNRDDFAYALKHGILKKTAGSLDHILPPERISG